MLALLAHWTAGPAGPAGSLNIAGSAASVRKGASNTVAWEGLGRADLADCDFSSSIH